MTKQEIIDYMYENHVQGDFKIEEMAEDLAQPASEPQKWIPCDEITGVGLPKKDGFYYVTEQNYGCYSDSDKKQCFAHASPFSKGDFINRIFDADHSNIVAWMPLPDPWKGENP